ncbi:LysR substrate-binding domain-containing protein [Cereibacter sphaeroides]|uniref:LysR family transcriptional regulator n=1 Tax=Cereibacter sphaeroides TaxID=1063 RepID=UPI003990C3D6
MDESEVTLDRMRTFVRVAERGSLSAVARDMRIGQSSVTRHLNELERAVGVALLSRTTRRVTLTEEGHRYYLQAVQILRLVAEASDEARRAGAASSGLVRLSCTAALGVRHIGRLIHRFQDRHPEIEVDLGLTDERIDLVREGVDLAIRLGTLGDSRLKLRFLGRSRRILVASPGYLDRRGRPQTPADLERHEGIRMFNIAGSERLALDGPDGTTRVVPFGGRLRVDHGLAAREAYRAGRGLGPAHLWLVDDLLADGQLERILPDHALPSIPLSLLIVPERAQIARIRLMVEFLAQEVAGIPGIGRDR